MVFSAQEVMKLTQDLVQLNTTVGRVEGIENKDEDKTDRHRDKRMDRQTNGFTYRQTHTRYRQIDQ